MIFTKNNSFIPPLAELLEVGLFLIALLGTKFVEQTVDLMKIGPDQLWGPSSLLSKRQRGLFSQV
jgi:hypothetical protein